MSSGFRIPDFGLNDNGDRPPRQPGIRNPKSGMPVIGLVGGVASGKSLVAAQFAGLGCEVVDADRLVHEILQEPPIRERVRQAFGDGVFDASGHIDRARLGEAVFSDPERLKALEKIVHPPVLGRIREALAAARARPGVQAVILDAALILEKGLDNLCDRVVYIRAEEKVRHWRALEARGWPPSEVARREGSQLPLKFKRQRADYVIDNSSTPEHTLDQVRTILARVVGK